MNKIESFENALKDLWKREDLSSAAAIIIFVLIPSTILLHNSKAIDENMMLYVNLFTVFVVLPTALFHLGKPILFLLKKFYHYREMVENHGS